MPKKGSSRRKRRARRVAAEQNLRYTDALHRSETMVSEPVRAHEEALAESGSTALEALHTMVERVQATDDAGTSVAAALVMIYEALALTATANTLIHEAMMDLGQVYSPGRNLLWGVRREYLDQAVQVLGSVLGPDSRRHLEFPRVRTLTDPQVAPQVYHPFQPDGYDGVVHEPDEAEKARQLLLFRTEAVAAANAAVWVHVDTLLARILDDVRELRQRKACRIAALLIGEILDPELSRDRREIDRRVLAIEVGRRSTAELIADEQLMQLLRAAVAAAAQRHGWSPLSAVVAALEHADPDWTAARWGHTSMMSLLAATKQFVIRSHSRKGQQVLEVRARRGQASTDR